VKSDFFVGLILQKNPLVRIFFGLEKNWGLIYLTPRSFFDALFLLLFLNRLRPIRKYFVNDSVQFWRDFFHNALLNKTAFA
jgi:hypothetical protein